MEQETKDCGNLRCPPLNDSILEFEFSVFWFCVFSRLLRAQSLEWFYNNVKSRFKRFGSAKVLKNLYRKHRLESGACFDILGTLAAWLSGSPWGAGGVGGLAQRPRRLRHCHLRQRKLLKLPALVRRRNRTCFWTYTKDSATFWVFESLGFSIPTGLDIVGAGKTKVFLQIADVFLLNP